MHAVDATGRRVMCRAFKREQFIAWCVQLPQGCMVTMEACTSAHHWARRLRAMGLDARLIAVGFVSPYRNGGQERQERRHRRGGHLRSRLAPEHALRADQELPTARRNEPAPRARGAQGRTHRVHQPHAVAYWPSSAWSSARAPRCFAPCWAM